MYDKIHYNKKKKKVKKKTCLFTEKWLQGDPALAKNLQKLLQRSKVKCFGLSGGWDRVVFSTHECTGPGGQQSSGNRDPRMWTGVTLPPSPVWPLTALHVWGHWLKSRIKTSKPWSRKWQPTPVFCLGNPMDRGAWWATVHGVAKETWLSN